MSPTIQMLKDKERVGSPNQSSYLHSKVSFLGSKKSSQKLDSNGVYPYFQHRVASNNSGRIYMSPATSNVSSPKEPLWSSYIMQKIEGQRIKAENAHKDLKSTLR